MNGTMISLHQAAAAADDASGVAALCAALDLPAAVGAAGEAPEWVHLLPAGEIRTMDGRGPYRVTDAAALAAASLPAGDKLPIDENHATDLAAPRGEPAPARGWIVALQARDDGIWGRVEWTPIGRRLVAGKAYRGLSPAIHHRADGAVTAILRASLVNRPNLRGLTTLHQENTMDLLARLLAALGLPATTSEDTALTAVAALHAAQGQSATALQAALDPIAQAVGLQAGASPAAVLAGVQGAKSGDQVILALQTELATVTTRLNGLLESGRREKAEAFVDAAIKAGRVAVKPQRDRYIAMHIADAANAEALIGGLPILGGGLTIVPETPPSRDGEVTLNAAQAQAAQVLGIDPKAYAATLKAEREAAL